MAKPNTSWSSNPGKYANVIDYNDANTTYSSATQNYVSATNTEDELGKPSTAWSYTQKIAAMWQYNPAYYANQYPYDSGVFMYDSATQTYDGVVTGQNSVGTKPQTAWTNV